MKINSTPLSFKARNPEIRFADDLARRINNAYPTLSSSKIQGDIAQRKKFKNLELNMGVKMHSFRQDVSFRSSEKNGLEKILIFLEALKTKKVANCGEKASLSLIAAKLNEMENCQLASLVDKNGECLDHAVLYINNGKKPYVIDSWLGFADYVPDAMKKYAGEYRKYFDLKDGETLKDMNFSIQNNSTYQDILKWEMKDCHLDILKSCAQELVIKK